MELFRRNNKVDKFIIINGNVIHAYFDYNNIIAIKKQLAGIGSLNSGLSGKSTTINDSTQ
jgi:hypothetical protein